MTPEQQLPFTPGKFEARITRAREGMARRDIRALIVTTPENLFYLSGYNTPAYYSTQALVLPLDNDPFLFVYSADADNVRDSSCITDCEVYGPADEPMPALTAALRRRGLADARLGLEMQSPFFPVALYRQLAEALGAELQEGSGIVEDCRAVKSAEEIAYIREGGRIASLSMRAVRDAIRAGASENDLAAAAYASAIRAGSTFPGSPPYIASGPRVCRQHASWHGRIIQPGDQVFTELSGCVHRYSSALARTFYLGARLPDVLSRLEERVIAGLNAVIAMLRPGVPSHAADAACRDLLAASGYHYPHETGYSIGVCYPPGWNETHVFNLKPGDTRPIQANMVLHLIPLVILPGVGAVGLSETVLVTESGPEILTDFPREMLRL